MFILHGFFSQTTASHVEKNVPEADVEPHATIAQPAVCVNDSYFTTSPKADRPASSASLAGISAGVEEENASPTIAKSK